MMEILDIIEHSTIALLIIAVLLLIACKIWHFSQHFKLQSCCIPSRPMGVLRDRSTSILSSSSSIMSALENKRSPCRCICVPPDDEEFDFFPMAFFLYLIFLIIVCITIITRFLLMDHNFHMNHNFPFTSPEHIPSIANLHSINIHHNQFTILILDWTLIYFIMLISLIESLFSWYRYYTTLMTTQYLRLLTTMDILKKYSFYAILFTIFYIITMHFYFYLFPFVIILHSTFNLFCNFKFSSLLISSYSMFIDRDYDARSTSNSTNKDILDSVYFMKRASLTCTIIQSIYLCIFIFVYNIDIIIYLPILWSVSSAIFTLNFIRNRQPFTQCCIRCKIQRRKPKQNENYELNIMPSIQKQNPKNILPPSQKQLNIPQNRSGTKSKKVGFNVIEKSTVQRKQKALQLLGVDAPNPLDTHHHQRGQSAGGLNLFQPNIRINKASKKINRNHDQPQTPQSAPTRGSFVSFKNQKKSKYSPGSLSRNGPLTPSKILASIRNAVEFPFDSKKHNKTDDANVPFYANKPTLQNQHKSVSNPIYNMERIRISIVPNARAHLKLKNNSSAPTSSTGTGTGTITNPTMNESVKHEIKNTMDSLPLGSTNLRVNNTVANAKLNAVNASFESVTIGSATNNVLNDINDTADGLHDAMHGSIVGTSGDDHLTYFHGNAFSDEYTQNHSDFEFSIETEDNAMGKEFEKYVTMHPSNVSLKIPHFVSTMQNTARNANIGGISDIEMEKRRISFDPNYVVQKLNIYLHLLKSLGVCSNRTVNNAKQLQVAAYHNNVHLSQSNNHLSQSNHLSKSNHLSSQLNVVSPNLNVNYTGSTHL